METNVLIEGLLRQLIEKVDGLKDQVATMKVDSATVRGDLMSQILLQSNNYDTKLLNLERRFDTKLAEQSEKLHARISDRAEKVDGWFDQMQQEFAKGQKEFSEFQTKNEGRMTGISVKVGLIFSGITVVLVALVTGLIRWLTSGQPAS